MRLFKKDAPDQPLGGLRVRKLADKTTGDRVKRVRVRAGHTGHIVLDPATGDLYIDPDYTETILWNPDTPEFEHEPWPLASVVIEGDTPARCVVSTSFVDRATAEGWATLKGDRLAHRPGGPPEDPWRVTHTFRQGDWFVLHTEDGDLKYRILENPDKWPETKISDDVGFGGEVKWSYLLELED